VTDKDDWRRIATIVLDRLIGRGAPQQIGLHARGDAGVPDMIGQTIHAARINQSSNAAEQVGAAAWLGDFSFWRTSRRRSNIGCGRNRDRRGGRRTTVGLTLSSASEQCVEGCGFPSV